MKFGLSNGLKLNINFWMFLKHTRIFTVLFQIYVKPLKEVYGFTFIVWILSGSSSNWRYLPVTPFLEACDPPLIKKPVELGYYIVPTAFFSNVQTSKIVRCVNSSLRRHYGFIITVRRKYIPYWAESRSDGAQYKIYFFPTPSL